jgi:hypothetical protein
METKHHRSYRSNYGLIMNTQHFVKKLKETGLLGLPFSWSDDGDLSFGTDMTAEQIAQIEAIAAMQPSAAELLADKKVELAASVDDSIAAIYSKFTRFSDEYRMRELEAQAFADAGYIGTVGALVQGYAITQPGMTYQQATDAILAQAVGLRTALTTLGNLRMRKNEIKAASVLDEESAQSIHDEIITLAFAAVANL